MPQLCPAQVFDRLVLALEEDNGCTFMVRPRRRDRAETAITRMLLAGWNPEASQPGLHEPCENDMVTIVQGEEQDRILIIDRWAKHGGTELDAVLNELFEGP